jgi:ABC-2 type transport system ATP-binding protein
VTAAAVPALAVRGLRKAYGAKRAVDALELEVPAGSFFGLVGPNGAGKTTTLKMIAGLLRPDGGRVEVQGIDVWAEPLAAKRRIGVLPETLQLFERLTGRQLLTYTGLLRGMEPGEVERRGRELLDVLALAGDAGTLVVDYSLGMRKKIALATALLHAPPLLLLDEPFESVDPLSARTVRGVLDRHRLGGGTIVFSSHVMELVERLCDHVAVVHQGRVVASGPLDEVRGDQSLEDAFVALVGGEVAEQEGLEWLRSSSG